MGTPQFRLIVSIRVHSLDSSQGLEFQEASLHRAGSRLVIDCNLTKYSGLKVWRYAANCKQNTRDAPNKQEPIRRRCLPAREQTKDGPSTD